METRVQCQILKEKSHMFICLHIRTNLMHNIVKDTMHFIKNYKELNSEITHKIEIYFSQGTTNVQISIYVHTYTMKVNNIQKIRYQANINYP